MIREKQYELIDRLEAERILAPHEFLALLEGRDEESARYLFKKARAAAERVYGREIFVRGLIEFTNYCKNDCYYCGIRRSNDRAQRYRLTDAEILECCKRGYDLGLRTFVLQGGEDACNSDERLTALIKSIKERFPDCALTLSVGERTSESYRALRDAGADRYLLRHETADEEHYSLLHPKSMTAKNRKGCIFELKEMGFQVGCGFMVGSPFQTNENIVSDLLFIKEVSPQMLGVGPFIPHAKTPFASHSPGTLELTLFLLGIIRLMLPNLLLSATTALATIHEKGRELGVLAGANVVMPNLSPTDVRGKYLLYDNKANTGSEAAEALSSLKEKMAAIGYHIGVSRGDPRPDIQ